MRVRRGFIDETVWTVRSPTSSRGGVMQQSSSFTQGANETGGHVEDAM